MDRVQIDWCWSWMTKGLEGVVRQLEKLAETHTAKPDQIEEMERQAATLARAIAKAKRGVNGE